MQLNDTVQYQTKWRITKFKDDDAFANNQPFEQVDINHNLLLNEGIGELWDLVCGLGSPAAFNNANARIGVGDSTTAAAAAQTDLQAATNKTYKAMDTGYPSRAATTVTFQSVFGSAEANHDWEEFSVDNGAAAGMNLNRKVSAQGTKASGQTWTLQLQITLS